MKNQPWWADGAARALLDRIGEQTIVGTDVTWMVRVDEPHPSRREKAGDYITMLDGRVTLGARSIWAGWTPGYQLTAVLADGTRITGPWTERLVCCDMHNVNCEPPSELCCEYCTEAFHPNHTTLIPCVLKQEAAA